MLKEGLANQGLTAHHPVTVRPHVHSFYSKWQFLQPTFNTYSVCDLCEKSENAN